MGAFPIEIAQFVGAWNDNSETKHPFSPGLYRHQERCPHDPRIPGVLG